MEPISLCSITVLLHYELMISDPRFEDTALITSSFVDPSRSQKFPSLNPRFVKDQAGSVQQLNIHIFARLANSSLEAHPLIFVDLHPNAESIAKNLTFTQRELIFLKSRNHSGCFKAAGLYQMFFQLCDPDQRLSIQLKDESPTLVDIKACAFLKVKIRNPKVHTISSIRGPPGYTVGTGGSDEDVHGVMAIPDLLHTGKTFILDMTRMQYGEAARGLNGENYFLGTVKHFAASIESVCGEAEIMAEIIISEEDDGTVEENMHLLRLRNCAAQAFERWQNREK